MKLDFDIETKSPKLDFDMSDTKVVGTGDGVSEFRVREIIEQETADLQPKTDGNLKTNSKEIVGAINELHNREDKQGLSEEQVKEVVRATAVTKESDPTVPDWAKQASKPTYSYNEIKDKPNLFSGNYNDLSNKPDLFSGDYNDLSNKPTIPSTEGLATEEYADNVSAQAVAQGISSHNVDQTAHKDIRNLISELSNRLNAIADSDDTTLDQLSEIVAYIKANKALIESVTTSKVNVADIVNDLETNVANKPLSASQGVALKTLIDTLEQSVSGLEKSTVKSADRDSFVIGGLTENSQTLTSEQQASACYFIGAIPLVEPESVNITYLQSIRKVGGKIIYELQNINIFLKYESIGTGVGSIIKYEEVAVDFSNTYGNGTTIYVDTPKYAKQAVNKKYVDDLVGDIESVLTAILGV